MVGLGSIGRRHLANLRQLEPTADITVLRRPSSDSAVPDGATRVIKDAPTAWSGRPDLALITGPASTHLTHATEAALAGAHLFIEKPLATTADGLSTLLADCRANGLTVLVGYNFRFYPPLQLLREAVLAGRIGRIVAVRAEVGQYLPDWRPGADYRQSVSARATLGGGALLELSHELDYIRWIAGEVTGVGARVARLGGLDIDVEDVAEILLEFQNGAIGSVHLDMLQRVPSRTCKIVGTEGTLTWDGLTNAVRLYSTTTGAWTDVHHAVAIDRNDMYMAEMRHFLECVRGKALPVVTGDDGLRVVDIVEAARRASKDRRMVTL